MSDALLSNPSHADVHSLRHRYRAMLALFVLIALLTAGDTLWHQRSADTVARDLAQAEARRTQVQQVAVLLAARTDSADPKAQAELGARARAELAELERIGGADSPALRAFVERATAAVAAEPGARTADVAALLALASGELATELDSAVSTLKQRSAAAQSEAASLHTLARISLIVSVIAAVLLVFWPAARVLNQKLHKLETSQEQLEAVLNTVAEAIITVAADGRIVTANYAAQRVWGYSKAELVGMQMIMLLSPDQRKQQPSIQHYGYYGDLDGRDAPRQLLEGARKDGARFPLELHVTETRLTSQTLLTIAARDVTARRQAEAALAASEATLRSFFESAPLMMGIVEIVDDAIVHISDNPRAASFFGHTAEAMAQRSAQELGVSPEASARWLEHYRASERHGTPVKFEYAHPTAHGVAWLSATISALGPQPGARRRFCYVVEDITRQKRAADHLTATSARLSTLIESLQTGIVMADEHGRVHLVNGGLVQMMGGRQATGAYIGQTCADLAQTSKHLFAAPDEFIQNFERTMAERRARVGEEWLLADGRTVERDYVPIVVDGQPRGHLWQYRDISARKAADAALRESRVLLSGIVASAMDGVITIDEHGVIQEFNPAAEAMFGRSRAAMLGHSMDSLIPAEYRAAHHQGMRRYLGTGEKRVLDQHIEITALRADGTAFPVELTVTRMPVAGPPLFTGFIRDISKRKAAEAELRNSEQSIRQLYDITADQRSSLVDKIQALLEMGCQRFGLEVGVLAQVKDDLLEVIAVYPPDAPLTRGAALPIAETFCRNTIAQPQPHSIPHVGASPWRTYPCYAALGIEAYFGTRVMVDGELYGTLYFWSRTPRQAPFKPVETEFLRLMAQWIGGETERERTTFQLEAYAAEIDLVNEELAAARDQALEVSRLKSEFLATMSHEIRTPMSAIIGMAELLHFTPLSQDQQEFARVISTSAHALLQIINDILDFSKIEAGKMVLDQAELAVGEVVESVAELLAANARAKGLALMTFVAPDVPELLLGDGGRLRQVLMNLAGNALKFTERGEVVIWVRRVEHAGPHVLLRVEVKDTGIGIPAETRARLFQPFTQADGSTSRKYGGTGLGLAISQRLITLMGGAIGVDSVPGAGSTFWFTLRLEQPPLQLPAVPRPTHAELHGRRVLIVDDAATSRTILEAYCGGVGAVCQSVADGAAALEVLAAAARSGTPFELALIDLRLPDMDGLALAETIRARIAAPPAMALITAFDQRGRGEEAYRAGFRAYLSKPVRQAQLIAALVQALRDSRLHGAPMAETQAPGGLEPDAPRVLIVDDNPANRRVTTLQLAKAGYAARSAAGGHEALMLLAAEPQAFAAVLMDCNMPELDGYATTRALRERERTAATRLPIIAMTANAMPGDRERCLEAGMDDYISKPIKVEALRRALERWVPAAPALAE